MKKPVKKKTIDKKENYVNTLFGMVEVKKEEVISTSPVLTPFSFVNDVSFDKKYLFTTDCKDFKPFLVNKALSAFPDCLSAVAFLNSNHGLSDKMQHDYLFYSLPKRKRFKKDGWLKKTDAEKTELAMLEDIGSVINYNLQRTKQFWSMLTDEQKQTFLSTYVYPNSKNEKK